MEIEGKDGVNANGPCTISRDTTRGSEKEYGDLAGFTQDPIQFINLIADNLRDRYQSGFPVLKELLQNTDDSRAKELHFGRSPGLPAAEHILLHGPALFFINDGCFSLSDALGIRSFGQNSKAADAASIGKFGLGMKSVFHFCEAFFFIAHDGERPYAEVLNPWSGPESVQSLHAEWDEFSEADGRAIRDHLAPVAGKAGSKVRGQSNNSGLVALAELADTDILWEGFPD